MMILITSTVMSWPPWSLVLISLILQTATQTRADKSAQNDTTYIPYEGQNSPVGKRLQVQNTSGKETARDIPDEQRLMNFLFNDYDTSARPVINASHNVSVAFGFALIMIPDMDEVNQILTTNVWLEQNWVDERLRWDPDEYGGVKVLRVPCKKLWLPDIVLYNSADDFTSGYMQSKGMVSYEGNVFWPPPAKLRSSCKVDITYFPFDDQECKMKFGSWSYDGFQVDVVNKSNEVDLSNYVFSGEWELRDIIVERHEIYYPCCAEPYPDVTFTIRIRRKTLYYLFNVIFPCLWLTVLSLLCFWLPPDSGEKITLGITVLLAFSVFMLLIAESMPATSEFVPLIGLYLTTTMAMTSFSIVLTVIVLQLHHSTPHQRPVPRWVHRLVFEFLARILCVHQSVDDEMLKRDFPTNMEDIPLTTSSHYPVNENGNRRDVKDANNAHKLENGSLHIKSDDSSEFSPPHTKDFSFLFGRNDDSERISRHLQLLVARQDCQDRHDDIANEWRLVAYVIDRLLFWLFVFTAVTSTLVILVYLPSTKPDDAKPSSGLS